MATEEKRPLTRPRPKNQICANCKMFRYPGKCNVTGEKRSPDDNPCFRIYCRMMPNYDSFL